MQWRPEADIAADASWPVLTVESCTPTRDTLHMWTQIFELPPGGSLSEGYGTFPNC